MNRIAALLAGAAFSAAATSAIAADAVYDFAPVYDWTGAYLGAQVGYGWGNGGVQYHGGADPFSDISPDGFLAGIYAGYNHQFSSRWVLGVDADITWHNADDWAYRQVPGSPPFNDPDYMDGQDIKWSAALRGKVGYAVDRWLPYVAGGVSVAKVNLGNIDGGIYTDFGDATFTGWNLGVGVDYAWSDNLLLRAEYRYTDFGNKNVEHPSFFPSTWHLETSEVRFGIAYKF